MKTILLLTLLASLTVQANEKMIGLGVGANSVEENENNVKKSGLLLEIKGIYSLDVGNWNSDFGLGYQRSRLEGELNPGTIKVTTNAVFLELDTKYKVLPSVYIGPMIKGLFGTDVSFEQRELGNSSNAVAGLKAQYDFLNQDELNYRLETSVGSSFKEPKNMQVLVGLNIGWKTKENSNKIKPAKPAIRPEEEMQVQPATVQANIEPPLTVEAEPDFKVTIKSARILFGSDHHTIDSNLSNNLKTLASYLVKENSNWGRIKISGHTDNEGSFEYNKVLGQKRADAIKNVLVSNGVDAGKIESNSFSYMRPIADNSTAAGRSKNRRTEIEFYNIKDRNSFNKHVVDILSK